MIVLMGQVIWDEIKAGPNSIGWKQMGLNFSS